VITQLLQSIYLHLHFSTLDAQRSIVSQFELFARLHIVRVRHVADEIGHEVVGALLDVYELEVQAPALVWEPREILPQRTALSPVQLPVPFPLYYQH